MHLGIFMYVDADTNVTLDAIMVGESFNPCTPSEEFPNVPWDPWDVRSNSSASNFSMDSGEGAADMYRADALMRGRDRLSHGNGGWLN